jgi:hypothetical protein
MLCGASDTERIRGEFAEVVGQFGGDPWHYLSGRILHLNSAQASWERNSRVTVTHADLCVFVVVERYGQVTWETELREAISSGKPFLLFCLDITYQRYLTLSRAVVDPAAVVNSDDRLLVATLRELESDRELTIVPFRYGYFGHELRRQMAALYAMALGHLEERNRRAGLSHLMSAPDRLTPSDLTVVVGLALDEAEDKWVRKQAVRALAARRAADEETVLGLLSSIEQGVQRLVVHCLDELYATRPADADLLEQCVAIVNTSDDVGLARRLIPSLLRIDVPLGVRALGALDLVESGVRRRLAEALEAAEEEIVRHGLVAEARHLLSRCLEDAREAGWRTRCRALDARLATAVAAR